jgi:Sulfotransferase family
VSPRQLPLTPGLVLHRWKVVYVITPKAACTSMMWTIAELQREQLAGITSSLSCEVTRTMAIHHLSHWCHTRVLQQLSGSELLDIQNSGEWFIFCLSRHPVDRLWSAWQSKLLLREPYYVSRYGEASWFPQVPAGWENISEDFELFVHALEEDRALRAVDSHWKQQCELLQVSTFPYTHVGKVEAMTETLQALEMHLRQQGWRGKLTHSRHNVSLLPSDAGLVSEKIARRIERLYVNDMTAFGYTPTAPTLTLCRASAQESTAEPEVVSSIVVRAIREIIARHERIGDLQHLALALSRMSK